MTTSITFNVTEPAPFSLQGHNVPGSRMSTYVDASNHQNPSGSTRPSNRKVRPSPFLFFSFLLCHVPLRTHTHKYHFPIVCHRSTKLLIFNLILSTPQPIWNIVAWWEAIKVDLLYSWHVCAFGGSFVVSQHMDIKEVINVANGASLSHQ